MDEITIEHPLSRDFSYASLLKFALPTITMMICMGLYTIGDTIVVSRFINTDALSAINIVCPIINLMVGISGMIATGGNAIIAFKMGEKNPRANQDFTLLVLFSCILGFLFAMLGTLFLDDLIHALGASPLQFEYCKDYLGILILFTPACFLQVLFQNLMVTAGKPTFGLVLSLGAGLCNVILDYIFIVPMDMGIKGSALGTAIGYLIPAIIGLCFFANKQHTLTLQKPVFDLSILAKTCSNGASEMVSQVASAVTTFFFNISMMNLVGEAGVAAITILIYSQFLLTSIYIGFSMGTSSIISYQYGANDIVKLQKLFKKSGNIIAITSLLTWILALCWNESLIALFGITGTQVYTLTKDGFSIFAFSFLFSGINIYASAFFTALSNGLVSAIISFLRTFGFILVCLFLLPKFWGVNGVWFSVPIAEFLACIVSVSFFLKMKNTYHYL